MASLGLLLLSAALLHAVQALPAGRGRGRGLDVSLAELSRQRRDLRNLLPYEDRMSYPSSQGGGGATEPFYQSDGWRGQGLDQALQRLVERDQRRAQEEEQKAAYLAALLRLLSEAESAGLVDPEVEVVEEEEDMEDDEGAPGDFKGPAPPDYDETGRAMSMGRPPAAWWGLLEPQLAQALLERMEPQVAQSLLQRARQERPVQTGLTSGPRGGAEQEAVRRLVSRLLSGLGAGVPAVMSSGHRARRDVSFAAAEPLSPAHRRTRRSLDDLTPPSPSGDPPLLRVKRLEDEEEEEERLRPPAAAAAGLQRMKRIDSMAANAMEELHHGSRRRRRRAVNYDPQILMDGLLQYMRE